MKYIIIILAFIMTSCVHLQNLISESIDPNEFNYCVAQLAESEFLFSKDDAGNLCKCILTKDQTNDTSTCLEKHLSAFQRSEEFDERLRFHTNCTANFESNFSSGDQAFVFCSCLGGKIFEDQVKGKLSAGLPVIIKLENSTFNDCALRSTGTPNGTVAAH